MKHSDNPLCVYSARIVEGADDYVIQVPDREIELETVRPDATYKIAMLELPDPEGTSQSGPRQSDESPPVDVGDEIKVEIESLGEEGDGVARIERGFVIFVPDTDVGEQVTIEVKKLLDSVGFAEVAERHEPKTFD